MNKKELIKLLDKYEIEYEITDNTKEVEEGLRLLDEALEKIGIIIPKETQINNITRENDTEIPNYTTEWASSSDLISRQAAIEAVEKQYFGGTVADINPSWRKLHNILESLPPVTPTEQNEEDILKFYYVESLDEYWIGQRCGTRYYGKWTGNCFTFGYSRYLPWGEHVVAPDTLWKEHTYPSEPKEIPFNEWLQGFLEKKCQTERTGKWIPVKKVYRTNDVDFPNTHIEWETATEPDDIDAVRCSKCGEVFDFEDARNWCTECGAKMKGGDTE